MAWWRRDGELLRLSGLPGGAERDRDWARPLAAPCRGSCGERGERGRWDPGARQAEAYCADTPPSGQLRQWPRCESELRRRRLNPDSAGRRFAACDERSGW